MPHLMLKSDAETIIFKLPLAQPVTLPVQGDTPVRRFESGIPASGPILAPRVGATHVLIAPPDLDVLVGSPLIAGTSILEDQDQLRVGSRLFTYQAHDWVDPSRVEPYRGTGGKCILEDTELREGEPCVFCPHCGYAMRASAIKPTLEACPNCECPVAHTDEQAQTIALSGGRYS